MSMGALEPSAWGRRGGPQWPLDRPLVRSRVGLGLLADHGHGPAHHEGRDTRGSPTCLPRALACALARGNAPLPPPHGDCYVLVTCTSAGASDTVPASVPAMDPTSSASPSPVVHGVIFGPLREVHPDRIVIADRTLFLRNGEACHHAIGLVLEVVFIEQNGRASVQRISVAGRPL